MKISFLIPTYNTTEFTIELIESLIDKCDFSKDDKEIWIFDNASNKEEIAKLENWMGKQVENTPVFLMYSRKNKGVGYAFNQMIKGAKGEYLIRLDSDTVAIQKDFDEKLISILEKEKDIGLVTCMTSRTGQPYQVIKVPSVFEDNKKQVYEYFTHTLTKMTTEYDTFTKEDEMHLAGYCFVFRKSDWDKHNWKFNDKLMCYGEDNIFCLDVIRSGLKTAIANKVFIWHYQGGTTKKMSEDTMNKIRIKAKEEWNKAKSL